MVFKTPYTHLYKVAHKAIPNAQTKIFQNYAAIILYSRFTTTDTVDCCTFEEKPFVVQSARV